MQGIELEAPSNLQVTGEWSHLAKLHPGRLCQLCLKGWGFRRMEKLELSVRARRDEGGRPGTCD